MAYVDRYRIGMDGNWSLEDLYEFPRAYEQVYFALYSLDEDLDEDDIERVARIYQAFPWQGGYSAVNFYNQLKYMTPRSERPQIASIRYSSPGWIELLVVVAIASQVKRIVKSAADIIEYLNDLYNEIIKGMQQRKLMRIRLNEKRFVCAGMSLNMFNAAQQSWQKYWDLRTSMKCMIEQVIPSLH